MRPRRGRSIHFPVNMDTGSSARPARALALLYTVRKLVMSNKLSAAGASKVLALLLVRLCSTGVTSKSMTAFVATGLFVEAPLSVLWAQLMLPRLLGTAVSTRLLSRLGKGLTRTLLTMAVFDPLYICLHFAFFGYAADKYGSVTECVSDISRKLPPVLKTSWKIWPAFTVMKANFIPQLRGTPTQVVELLWNIYLSAQSSRPAKKAVTFAADKTKPPKPTESAGNARSRPLQRSSRPPPPAGTAASGSGAGAKQGNRGADAVGSGPQDEAGHAPARKAKKAKKKDMTKIIQKLLAE